MCACVCECVKEGMRGLGVGTSREVAIGAEFLHILAKMESM